MFLYSQSYPMRCYTIKLVLFRWNSFVKPSPMDINSFFAFVLRFMLNLRCSVYRLFFISTHTVHKFSFDTVSNRSRLINSFGVFNLCFIWVKPLKFHMCPKCAVQLCASFAMTFCDTQMSVLFIMLILLIHANAI